MTTNNKLTRFKIQGVGLDTTNMYESPTILVSEGIEFDYIHTTISSNNDYLLKDYFEKFPSTSLVTTIDFFNNPEKALIGHLMELSKSNGTIDLLLVTTEALGKNLDTIKDTVENLKTSGIIKEFGISNPSTIEDIESTEKILGTKIKYISLNICPLNFNYEIVKWCKDNSVDILGFNPFGGHLSASAMIESFTVPYLLGFSSTYSSVVFLGARNLLLSIDSRDYLKSDIIGSDINDKFILKKSIFKLYKPITSGRVVKTSLILKDDLILDYNSPEITYPLSDIVFNIGKSPSSKSIIVLPDTSLRNQVENSVYDILDITEFPKDASVLDKLAIARYQTIETLKINFPLNVGWKINIVQLCDKVFGISASRKTTIKKFLKKNITTNMSRYFILAITDEGRIIFIEDPSVKNSSKNN